MSKTRCSIIVALFALTVTSTQAFAKITTFTALLTSGQAETNINTTTGSGIAFFTYDKDTDTLTYSITFSGLSAAETVSHIHGPGLPGVAAGVVVGLPLGNPKNGSVTMFSTLLAGDAVKNLKKGLLYVNIHTGNNPSGEIRGQILPSSK